MIIPKDKTVHVTCLASTGPVERLTTVFLARYTSAVAGWFGSQ